MTDTPEAGRMMADRPIIFSAPMVRALLAGRKTQTRRVLKPQPPFIGGVAGVYRPGPVGIAIYEERLGCWPSHFLPAKFLNGDRLWVREAWNVTHKQHLAPGEVIERAAEECVKANKGFACACADGVVYRATGADNHPDFGKALWRSPIHMPRWASRLTLVVTEVRVQRLQGISEADAEAEGAEPILVPPDGGSAPHIEGYRDLWNSLHGPAAWDENPWVCALTFTVHKCNIDQMDDAND